MVYRICIILFAFACSINLSAQTEWKSEKNSNGIHVYSSDSGSLPCRAVKVECVLKGTMQKLLDIFRDVPNHKNWIYSETESNLEKKVSDHELLYYVILDFSAFTRKRDELIRMTINYDSIHHTAQIFTEGEPNGIPEKKGLVRIPVFHSRYDITEVDSNHLHIFYYTLADPGGSVPSWIMNAFIAKGPYNTFVNLAARLQQ